MAAKKFHTSSGRSGYDSDVSDQEWEFCCPYWVLMDPKAPQRTHDLRQVFNALRSMVRNGCHWRALPNDLQLGGGHALLGKSNRQCGG
jgi:hypothetical protein